MKLQTLSEICNNIAEKIEAFFSSPKNKKKSAVEKIYKSNTFNKDGSLIKKQDEVEKRNEDN